MEETISIVIPVFEEEESIPHLYRSIKDVMERLGRKYEILFVDDGSKDGSFAALEGIQRATRRLSSFRSGETSDRPRQWPRGSLTRAEIS